MSEMAGNRRSAEGKRPGADLGPGSFNKPKFKKTDRTIQSQSFSKNFNKSNQQNESQSFKNKFNKVSDQQRGGNFKGNKNDSFRHFNKNAASNQRGNDSNSFKPFNKNGSSNQRGNNSDSFRHFNKNGASNQQANNSDSFRHFNNKTKFNKQEQFSNFRGQEYNENSGKSNAPVCKPLTRKAPPPFAKLRYKPEKQRIIRDPRFDDISGKLDLAAFNKNYSFLADMKVQERKTLVDEMEQTGDRQEKQRITLALQRIDNQSREIKMKNVAKAKKDEERKTVIEAFKQGKRPYFKKNSDFKMEMIAMKFEALKKENKLQKYLERKEKGKRAKELFSK